MIVYGKEIIVFDMHREKETYLVTNIIIAGAFAAN